MNYLPVWMYRWLDFRYIGRNAMTYYYGHLIIVMAMLHLYETYSFTLFGVSLIVLSCTIILPVTDILLRRDMPWAVGAKPSVRNGVEIGAASAPLL